jgi:ATP:cob(I)alamin adenosyltransferase
MVVLNKIYTRTGDAGTTALGTGERVPKHAPRIAAYGTVDEANAAVGVARLQLAGAHPDVDAMLGRIQNDLFDPAPTSARRSATMPSRSASGCASAMHRSSASRRRSTR